jgi:hypothetical protein
MTFGHQARRSIGDVHFPKFSPGEVFPFDRKETSGQAAEATQVSSQAVKKLLNFPKPDR